MVRRYSQSNTKELTKSERGQGKHSDENRNIDRPLAQSVHPVRIEVLDENFQEHSCDSNGRDAPWDMSVGDVISEIRDARDI